MQGLNPIRPPVMGDGSLLDVKEVFPTLQGEGPRAGQPAVFIRLGGCNLACDFCDTAFEDFETIAVGDIVRQVLALAPPACGGIKGGGNATLPAISKDAENRGNIVSPPHPPASGGEYLTVITGGEPLRQNIAPLCEALLAEGFTVQVETNGTLWRPLPAAVEVVCSPKNTGQGYFPLREDVAARAAALKFIVSRSHPLYRDVPEVGQARYGIPVYVQPMDERDTAKNMANTQYALALAREKGYRLSLQLHKILEIP